MKRNKQLQRKTPMKRTGFKRTVYRGDQPNDTETSWPKKHAPITTKRKTQLAQRSTKRATQERAYNSSHSPFLAAHPVCPVTGEKTDQIHHSAKREGAWLNLKRYWIGVSLKGHAWIEANKTEAEKYGLMVRIRETCKEHSDRLVKSGISLEDPVFYQTHPELPLVNEITRLPIYL